MSSQLQQRDAACMRACATACSFAWRVPKLLDLCCGRGGDLAKWREAEVCRPTRQYPAPPGSAAGLCLQRLLQTPLSWLPIPCCCRLGTSKV